MKSVNRFYAFVAVLLIFISSVAMTGCKRFLDTQAQGSYNLDNYPYPGGSGPYDQFIFAAYNDLRSFNVHSQSYISAMFRSDDADKGSTPADGGANAIDMDNFPVQPSNGFCNTLWVGNYALINKCNTTIIQVVNNKEIVDPNQVKAKTIAKKKLIMA